ncbi:hypothetical protein M6B38_325750 [Iris pallida]|nr:hypothetical protein M6B38_325750 [Iris pallida]
MGFQIQPWYPPIPRFLSPFLPSLLLLYFSSPSESKSGWSHQGREAALVEVRCSSSSSLGLGVTTVKGGMRSGGGPG